MYKELFSRSGLSLDRLRSLCEVAAAGGISKAAEGDPVRQSQFSRQIRELESFFETELTARSGRNVVLTPSGRELVALAREAFSALSDFKRAQQSRPVDISVGAGDSFFQWLLLPKVARLRAETPDVIFSLRNLRTEHIVRGLQEVSLDFGMLRADAVPKGLKGHRLGVMRYSLFVSAKRADPKGDLSWQQALALPFVGLDADGDLMRKSRTIAERLRIPVQTVLRCSSLPAVAVALSKMDGVAILPVIAPFPGLREIKAPFLREFDREIRLVWNPRQMSIRPVMDRVKDAIVSFISW